MTTDTMRRAFIQAFGKPQDAPLSEAQLELLEWLTDSSNMETAYELGDDDDTKSLAIFMDMMFNVANNLNLSDAHVLQVYSTLVQTQAENALKEEHKWKD